MGYYRFFKFGNIVNYYTFWYTMMWKESYEMVYNICWCCAIKNVNWASFDKLSIIVNNCQQFMMLNGESIYVNDFEWSCCRRSDVYFCSYWISFVFRLLTYFTIIEKGLNGIFQNGLIIVFNNFLYSLKISDIVYLELRFPLRTLYQ